MDSVLSSTVNYVAWAINLGLRPKGSPPLQLGSLPAQPQSLVNRPPPPFSLPGGFPPPLCPEICGAGCAFLDRILVARPLRTTSDRVDPTGSAPMSIRWRSHSDAIRPEAHRGRPDSLLPESLVPRMSSMMDSYCRTASPLRGMETSS